MNVENKIKDIIDILEEAEDWVWLMMQEKN